MDAKLNQLAKIDDFEKAILLAQYAHENGFRGGTALELYQFVKSKLDLTGLSNTAGLPEDFPEPNSTLEATNAGEWTVLGPGIYDKIVSGTLEIADDEFAFAQFDGSDFNRVLRVTIPGAENRIRDWQSGTYTNGQQVNYKGYLWKVKVTTTTLEPDLGSPDWDLMVNLTPKQNTENIAWGVSDNTPDKNVVLYVDNVGKSTFDASEKAKISFVNIKEQKKTNNFDWGISDNTPNRNLILGVKDGKIWTRRGWIDAADKAQNKPINSDNRYFDGAEDYLLPELSAPNGIYNQWVEPMMVTDKDGVTFFTSIGNKGEIFLHIKRKDGLIRRRNIGTAQVDDHNGAAILLDDRDDAEFPLMIFQSNHQTTPMKWCKLSSKDPDDWNNVSWSYMEGGNVSYAQSFRYGDEIIVHCRTARRSEPEGDTRGIRWYYSSDNGDTWVYKTVFETLGIGDLYFQLKEKIDKSGINISINAHPQVYTYTGIRYMTLDWDSGNLAATVGGTPIVDDFRDIFFDDEWIPIEQFDAGLEVVSHNTSNNRKRMIDMTNNATGETKILYAYFPVNGNGMSAWRAGLFRLVSFDINTGGINYDIDLGECGMPWERPAGGNTYISLGCFIDQERVLLTRYRNQSYLDGGTVTTGNDGYSDFRVAVVRSDTDVDVYENILTVSGKAGRPYKSPSGDLVMYCQAESYSTYTTFNSNIFLLNTKTIKTWA